MRATVLFATVVAVVVVAGVAACGNDEVIPDAPANPNDGAVVDAVDADPSDACIDADVRR
jgi:hypothetical protein